MSARQVELKVKSTLRRLKEFQAKGTDTLPGPYGVVYKKSDWEKVLRCQLKQYRESTGEPVPKERIELWKSEIGLD